ncbi:hypothetical protein TARUN_7733 [Trichoderma arundinaceum]|uniref:Uncharacterized protein n=1 Tax=Trichoderma arundinaceum TaxID=490622 RepID=A0A395NEZ4_TRIAR|nr:hypothetical protein TARUN_7733 [Trichoderma arundinaceum]
MAETSPSSPHFSKLSSTPPCSPRAWTWKCHQCHRRYPLSCTRRCLYCSHTLCFSHEGSKKKKASSCDTEFDFAGWKAYYEWRRELQEHNPPSKEAQANGTPDTSEEEGAEQCLKRDQRPGWLNMMLENKYDCTIDCIYPSECFHKLRELAEPISRLSSAPSSPKTRRGKETKKHKKHKSRRRRFQKQPSRLNPEWQAQKTSYDRGG